MNRSRSLVLLGPLVLLYLIADVASEGGAWSPWDLLIASGALLLVTAPMFFQLAEHTATKRLGYLGFFLSLGLLSEIEAARPPEILALSSAGQLAVAALLLDLAWTVPDHVFNTRRGNVLRFAIGTVAAGALLWIIAEWEARSGVRVLPRGLWSAEDGLTAPPSRDGIRGAWPTLALLLALFCALTIRLTRQVRGHQPESLAADRWATFALLLATPGTAGTAILHFGAFGGMSTGVSKVLALLTASVLLAGHGAMCDARAQHRSGPGIRILVTALATALVVGVCGAGLNRAFSLPAAFLMPFLVVASMGSLLVFRLLRPLLHPFLAPAWGRLLDAVERTKPDLGRAGSFKELAAVLLPRLRDASGDWRSGPLVFLFDPEREARIDQAGIPHVRSAGLPAAINQHFRESPTIPLVYRALRRLVVRKPAVRPLADAMDALDAEAVVPVLFEGTFEGAFILPRGARRWALTVEELEALRDLAHDLSGPMALLSARLRALARTKQAEAKERALRERVEVLEEQRQRAQADADTLRKGGVHRSSPPLAYAPSMRKVRERALQLAPLSSPLLFVAEGGSDVEALAREVHAHSGRSSGSFLAGDCGALCPEEAARVLFGEHPPGKEGGWLRLAQEGTLLLQDVPALPLEVQEELAETLATHDGHPVGAASYYPVDVRIIASAPLSLEALEARGSFHPELARWFRETTMTVPPLRERREDLESLLWVMVDRACRIVGREVLGVSPEARQRLLTHAWPGNEQELQWVVTRAVTRAEGKRIEMTDLPSLTAEGLDEKQHPLDGSLRQVERRLLMRALERTGGNKSEAARLVGLKRSTFLDKLKRQGLASEPPAALEDTQKPQDAKAIGS